MSHWPFLTIGELSSSGVLVPHTFTASFNAFRGRDCPANIGALGGSSLPPLAGPNSELLLAELAQLGNALSEDCLSINVWTKPQTGEKAKGAYLFCRLLRDMLMVFSCATMDLRRWICHWLRE